MEILRRMKRRAKTMLLSAAGGEEWLKSKAFYSRFERNAFEEGTYKDEIQAEAGITRLYHTIEKGLSYRDYRPGFGRQNVEALLDSMERCARDYGTEKFFYRTALCTLNAYIRRNREHGVTDERLERRIAALPGTPNVCGGAYELNAPTADFLKTANFEEIIKSRHSVREFDGAPVDMDALKNAVELAQHTPSACNRQGWHTLVIADKNRMAEVLKNQNGNRGFGCGIDKLLLVVGDLRAFNRSRELHQVFIDGGMYAANLLNALHYNGIASIPLSASLHPEQEKRIRKILSLHDAEVLILFVGVGSYTGTCRTTKSERKPAEIRIV